MEIKTLERIGSKSIVKVFNESFSDYFIPFKLTEEQLISKMLADKTDLSLSVGVFDQGKLIAFILHGFDIIDNKKVIYNGGTGVIPEKRGLGLTQQMYRFILPILVKQGVNKLILEVITKNIQAIKSYEKSGFLATRELLCFTGDVKVLNPNNDIHIRDMKKYNWEIMESFWDILPTWQNSKNILNDVKQNIISLGAYNENQLVGYVIYNPTNKRIQQIAVDKKFRKKRIASTLLLELTKKYGNTFLAINIDIKSKALKAFFNTIGLNNTLNQVEMELELDEIYNFHQSL